MAFNVGGISAFLTLDSSGFDRGVDNAGRKMQALHGTVNAGTQAISTGLVASTAAVATLTVNLGKAGVAYNSMQQNSRAALQTLLGSQKAVNDQMAKLNELASRSPFSKSIFIQGQQQLLAFGYEAEKVIPTLNAVQNAVAATGGSGQQLQDLIFVMAQIRAAGKITGQDLLQMGQRGVNAAELIGDAMGMTVAEVKEAISKNQIDAVAALDAITDGMTRKFGGATDLIKQQWSGATDRIKAAWRDTGADIARPFVDPNGGGQAVIWANLVADLMRQGQKQVQGLVYVMETRGKPVFQGVTKTLQTATAAVAKFDLNGVITQVDRLTKYEPLVKGTGAALLTLGLRPIPVLNALAGGMMPVVAGVAALVASTPELRRAGGEFATAFAPALPYLRDASVGVADLAMAIINTGAPALKELAKNGGRVLAELSPLAPAMVNVLNAGVPLVGMVANLVAAASSLPTPLLASVAAMAAFHKIAQAEIWTLLGSKIVGVADSVRLFAMYSKELGVLNAATQSAGGLLSTLTAFASPVGIATVAVGALAAAVAAFMKQAADSRRRVNELADSFDEVTGAITDNTKAIMYRQLVENGAIDAAKKLGVSLGVVTMAAMGNERAQEMLAKRTKELMDAQRAQYDTAAKQGKYTADLAAQMDETAKHVQILEKGVGTLSVELEEGRSVAADKAAAMAGLADSTETAAEAHKRLVDATRAATDAIREQAAASGDLITAQYRSKDALNELSAVVADSAGVQYDAAGAVDKNADANRRLVETTLDTIRAIHDEMDAFVKTGKTQAEVDERTKALTDSLYAQLEPLGLSREQAAAFAKELGFIPERKAVAFDFSADAQPAREEIKAVVKEVASSHGTMTIKADSSPATRQLLEALGAVNISEGVFTINAKDNPAQAALMAVLGRVDTSTGVLTIDAKSEPAQRRANEIEAFISGLAPALKIDGVDWGATATADDIAWLISRKVAYIQVRAAYSGENALGGLPMADGGVVEYYAGGGLRERHVAQIAPAGAWRVWAEPETGGEAYIPMAVSKRARSQQIIAEVARRFGDIYIPAGGQRYANGTINAPKQSNNPAPTMGGTTVYFTQNIQQAFTKPDSELASEGAATARLVGGL